MSEKLKRETPCEASEANPGKSEPFFDVFAPGPTPAFGFLVNVMSSLSSI